MNQSRSLTIQKRSQRGMTLLEVLISVGILALMSSLVYGAFDGMSKSRDGISKMSDRYSQGRTALARMTRELQSAFLSMHQPLVSTLNVRTTAFVGRRGSPTDRLDFTSFAHRRLGRDAHESDQAEIGYFTARNPETGTLELLRREAKYIDLEPTKGGIVNVLAEDIESLEFRYLDPLLGQWVETWDSTQPAGQPMRLPMQVRVALVLRGGVGGAPILFQTKVAISAPTPLTFGIPRGG